tara:strand:- start:1255 stop:1521 length:267 start_codon:yes stop_codon:yes gene_type:complete
MSRFKKVQFSKYFYDWEGNGKFGITFKHNKQMYDLTCTENGNSFVFRFVPLMKTKETKQTTDAWYHQDIDYEDGTPILNVVIRGGKIL